MAPPIFWAFIAIPICPLCPVKAIELYVAISSALSVDLLADYLFRPLSSAGKIQNKQIANSTLQSRLRCYLQEAKIYNLQFTTLHSLRDGLAITLALSGSQLADIMEHVGWRHAPTASHYLKLRKFYVLEDLQSYCLVTFLLPRPLQILTLT